MIGSGATAVTLIPAMAPEAEHITMLQRSPGYVVTLPAQDPVAKALRRVLPAKAQYAITRWKNVLTQMAFYQLSRRAPRFTRKLIRRGVERQLPAGYDVDRDFEPRYNPWDERVCLVPGGDLFQALRSGRADVVTDTIETFTEKGVEQQYQPNQLAPATTYCWTYTALGISNVSFGLNPAGRQVLNSVYLDEAVKRGLDMAIVSPAQILPLARIPDEQREVALEVIYDKRREGYDPLQRVPRALRRRVGHQDRDRGRARRRSRWTSGSRGASSTPRARASRTTSPRRSR